MKIVLSTFLILASLFISNKAFAATQFEAENATLSGGAAKNTNHANYSGSGFIDGFYNSTSAQVSFVISGATAGSTSLTIRYSAGNGTSTSAGLYVNGTKIKNITCNGTSNWDTWANQVETVTLLAGNNTIALKAEVSSTSCINIDYISVQGPETYTLTMANDGHGTTTPAGSVSVGSGVATSIAATPASGYVFANWTVTSGTATIANPSSASTTVTLSSNATVRANFTATTYTLTMSNDGHGTTSPSGSVSVNYGVATTISATPASGYVFANWTVTSGTATIANPSSANTTVTLSGGNATVRANFTTTAYTLTVSNDGHGTTSPSGSVSVGPGVATSISATPATGYQFLNWTVSSGTATIANPTSAATSVTLSTNATIQANFTSAATNGTAVSYTQITSPVTVTANNTVVLALPFTAPSSGHIVVNVTGLYGTNNPVSVEQRGLEAFITLNSTTGGTPSSFGEIPMNRGEAKYLNKTAGFAVNAGANTMRLIATPRATLTKSSYQVSDCQMTIIFSPTKL